MKKRFALFLVLALLDALILTGCSSSLPSPLPAQLPSQGTTDGDQPDLIPATVGYWGGTCESPIFVAYENGYFRDAGLDVTLLRITVDVALLIANNELDVYELTPDQFKPIEQGLEVKIIDSLHVGCIQGAASADSGIKSPADLEGKRVGAEVGGIAQILIASQMVLAGKDPTKVQWRSYPLDQMEYALDQGEIDAFGAYDPWAEIAVQNGKVKFFSNTFDEGLNDVLCCFVGMSKKSLDANPDLGRRMSKAFKQACEYLQGHPEEAAEMIMDKGYIAGDARLNAKLIGDYTWIAGDKRILDASFTEIWRQVARAGALDKDPEDLDSYIQELYGQMVSYMGE